MNLFSQLHGQQFTPGNCLSSVYPTTCEFSTSVVSCELSSLSTSSKTNNRGGNAVALWICQSFYAWCSSPVQWWSPTHLVLSSVWSWCTNQELLTNTHLLPLFPPKMSNLVNVYVCCTHLVSDTVPTVFARFTKQRGCAVLDQQAFNAWARCTAVAFVAMVFLVCGVKNCNSFVDLRQLVSRVVCLIACHIVCCFAPLSLGKIFFLYVCVVFFQLLFFLSIFFFLLCFLAEILFVTQIHNCTS